MSTTVKVSSISSSNVHAYSAPSSPTPSPAGSATADYGISVQTYSNSYAGTRVATRITCPVSVDTASAAAGWVGGTSGSIATLDLVSRFSGPSVSNSTIALGFLQGTSAPGAPAGSTDPSTFVYPGLQSTLLSHDAGSPPAAWTGILLSRYGGATTGGSINLWGNSYHGNGSSTFNGADGADEPCVNVYRQSHGGSGTQYGMINLQMQAPTYVSSPTMGYFMTFTAGGSRIGTIVTPTGTSTAYTTTSDHRLKEEVTPISSGLDLVSSLQPKTWKWKNSEDHGIGFIAHELQEAIGPTFASEYGIVQGEKDKEVRYGVLVDADGNRKVENEIEVCVVEPTEPYEGYTWLHTEDRPVYQSIDASFLMAPLVASVKELKAILAEHEARIAALEV